MTVSVINGDAWLNVSAVIPIDRFGAELSSDPKKRVENVDLCKQAVWIDVLFPLE